MAKQKSANGSGSGGMYSWVTKWIICKFLTIQSFNRFQRDPSFNQLENSSKSNNPLQCPHCNKIYGQRKNLNQHIARVHESQRYKCEICDALLSSGYRLKSHLFKVHKKKNQIKFAKSALVVKTQSGFETSPDAKQYIIREQAEQISKLKIQLKKSKAALKNLKKKVSE